jgi:hypothetical protein
LFAGEERNRNEVKTNLVSGAIRPGPREPHDKVDGDVGHDAADRQAYDALADIVWRYFEQDIRTTLIEVQEVVGGDNLKAISKARPRKKEGK